MRLGGVAAFSIVAALAYSCGPDPDVQQLVEEVRATRLQRRAESTSSPTLQATRDLVDATVTPVGQLLATVSNAQQDLAERQAELTTELQRWTELVVTEISPADAALVASMQQRLQELEAAVAAQRARQDDVERSVGDALARLSEQLANFLNRLETLDARRGARAAAAAAVPPSPSEDAADQRPNLWPLWGVAFLAIGAGVWLMLPSASARAATRLRRAATAGGSRPDVTPLGDAESAEDRSAPEVEKLWSTAAMLGDAIVRIKGAGGGAVRKEAGRPSAERSDRAGVKVVGAESAGADPTNGASSAEAAVAAGSRREAALGGRDHDEARASQPRPRPGFPPGSLALSLQPVDAAAAQARVLQVLGRARRVLRQPAPVVEVVGDSLRVEFALVPETPPSERALLEHKVRAAAR